MKTTLSALCILFLSCAFAEAQTEEYTFDDFYLYALRGDVITALEIVDNFPDNSITPEQVAEKNRFYRRFRSGDDIVYSGETELVNNIMTHFHTYWDKVLLQKVSGDQALTELIMSAIPYMHENYYKEMGVSMEDLQQNPAGYLSDLLLKEGYHSNLGYTASKMDIFLWKDESRETYDVELPEMNVEVQVLFMEEVVGMGWQEYATLGKYYPGGWATETELKCPVHNYDVESEYFRVNFVAHEAQHFADYKTYPKLQQIDLEYRAKLAELSLAQETQDDILSRFLTNNSESREDPHAFANHCVIRDLSDLVFEGKQVSDIHKWQAVSTETINAAGKQLLAMHSDQLKKAGASEVSQLIN